MSGLAKVMISKKSLTETSAIIGILGLILGTISFLLGLSGITIIEVGKILNLYRNFWMFIFSGGIGVIGVGTISVIVSIVVASSLDEDSSPYPEKISIPKACAGCKNYHGVSYNGVSLICGHYPYGWSNGECPDWETNNSVQ